MSPRREHTGHHPHMWMVWRFLHSFATWQLPRLVPLCYFPGKPTCRRWHLPLQTGWAPLEHHSPENPHDSGARAAELRKATWDAHGISLCLEGEVPDRWGSRIKKQETNLTGFNFPESASLGGRMRLLQSSGWSLHSASAGGYRCPEK